MLVSLLCYGGFVVGRIVCVGWKISVKGHCVWSIVHLLNRAFGYERNLISTVAEGFEHWRTNASLKRWRIVRPGFLSNCLKNANLKGQNKK